MNHQDQVKQKYNAAAENYHRMVTTPELSFWNTYVERPAMTKILQPVVGGKKVLDLGSGSGVFTRMLKSWGADVVGSDLSEGMTEIARRENPDIYFFVESADELHYSDEEFDIVTSSLTMHYFESFERVFSEVSRVLRQGGMFVFSMQHPFDNSLDREGSDKVVRDKSKPLVLTSYPPKGIFEFEMAGKMFSLYKHSISEVINALAGSGFCIEEMVETMPIPEGQKADPERFEETSKRPTFLIIHSTKK